MFVCRHINEIHNVHQGYGKGQRKSKEKISTFCLGDINVCVQTYQ